MSYQPPQGAYPPPAPPPAKSNKVLWIVLGILIGVPTLLGVGCVACLAIIGMSSTQNGTVTSSTRTTTAGAPSTTRPAAPAPTATPKSSNVTLAGYNQLKDGMSYAEVVRILGKEGTEISSNNVAGYQTVMYQWEGESWGANMNAMFQNGKLISKSQFGLQ